MKITCHSCGKEYEVPVAGSYCCTCGSAIHVVVPTQNNERKGKECPACGEMILESAKKCKHCGEWIDGSHKEPQVIFINAPRRPKIRGAYVSLSILLGNWGAGEFYIGNYGTGTFLALITMTGVALLNLGQETGIIFIFVAWFFSLLSMFVSLNDPCFDSETSKQEYVSLYCNHKKKKVYIWLSLLLGFSGAGEFYIGNYVTSAIIGFMFLTSAILSFFNLVFLLCCFGTWVIAIISMFFNRYNSSFSINGNQ